MRCTWQMQYILYASTYYNNNMDEMASIYLFDAKKTWKANKVAYLVPRSSYQDILKLKYVYTVSFVPRSQNRASCSFIYRKPFRVRRQWYHTPHCIPNGSLIIDWFKLVQKLLFAFEFSMCASIDRYNKFYIHHSQLQQSSIKIKLHIILRSPFFCPTLPFTDDQWESLINNNNIYSFVQIKLFHTNWSRLVCNDNKCSRSKWSCRA